MIVRVDLATIPPKVVVLEQDVFNALKAVVTLPEHTWIDQEVLHGSAAETRSAPFDEGYSPMVAYATGKGWVDGDGRIRAHLEITTTTDSAAAKGPLA